MKLKKGDIFQIFFILIILIVMAILGLIVGKLGYEFTNAYKMPELHLNDSTNGIQANQLIQDMSVPIMDFFIFFFFLGSNIGLMIAAIRVKYSPTIIFLFILLMLIAGVLLFTKWKVIKDKFKNAIKPEKEDKDDLI